MEQTHPSARSFTTKATAEVTKFVIKVDGVDICEIVFIYQGTSSDLQ